MRVFTTNIQSVIPAKAGIQSLLKPHLILYVFLFLLTACGSNPNISSESGGVNFNIKLSRPLTANLNAYLTGNNICSDYGIETISAEVLNSSSDIVTSVSWSCLVHEGTITGVPAGSNYTVRLNGLDSNNSITWKGEKSGIDIISGTTAIAGTITMTYIGSDTTAPTVTSTSPSNNSTNVPVTTALTATFSEKMALSSINVSTFTVSNGSTSVSGSVTYDTDTMKATFTPSGSLSYSTTYTATITTDVEDMAGNRMQADYSWSFTTIASPITLASGLNWPLAIAVDSTSIYWVESGFNGGYVTGAGTVKKVNINGGTVTTLTSGLNNPGSITVDSTSVYWTEMGTFNNNEYISNTGAVKKVGINGGGVVTTLASGLNEPAAIVTDATSVYWTEMVNSGNTYTFPINKVSTNGGAVTTLASEMTNIGGITVDSTSIYWTVLYGGTVKKVGINGGTVTTLASGLSLPAGIVSDSTSVYWVEYDGSYLKKVGINGGTVTAIASDLSRPGTITVDSTSVYWIEHYYVGSDTFYAVKKVGINGGTITTIVSGLNHPEALAVDSTSVYWLELGNDNNGGYISGTVKKVSK